MGFLNLILHGSADYENPAKIQYENPAKIQSEIEKNQTLKWYQMQNDLEYQSLMRKYYNSLEKLEADYTVINHLSLFRKAKGDEFLSNCEKNVELIFRLIPYWQKYDEPIPCFPVFKRMSMAYEKREDYKSAAESCLRALREGFTNDGTNGGMCGRLARIVKKGKLDLTDEMKKYLEIE